MPAVTGGSPLGLAAPAGFLSGDSPPAAAAFPSTPAHGEFNACRPVGVRDPWDAPQCVDLQETAACMRAARLGTLAAQESALAGARTQVGLPPSDDGAAASLVAAGRALRGPARVAFHAAFLGAYGDAAARALADTAAVLSRP